MEPIPLASLLPADLDRALLVGRVWRSAPADGPCVVVVRGGEVVDVTASSATVCDLLDEAGAGDGEGGAAAFIRRLPGESLGDVAALMASSLPSFPSLRDNDTHADADAGATGRAALAAPAATPAAAAAPSAAGTSALAPCLLAPCDLQAIKACGVTFAVSLLERVIEERAGGDPSRAEEIRRRLQQAIGDDLSTIRPGSEGAARLKDELVSRGFWSQYLEVGIGPDAEVFTKAQPMSSVGFGSEVGLHPSSRWNNPEPEIVLAVDSRGRAVGATLGNDVNLRDIEGRSALLLGKAKDNNGSCAIGPFIRLFDGRDFTLDTVRSAEVRLTIEGADDGFRLDGTSRMSQISREPLDLVAQTCGPHHQYPDGFMLFLGTMFSPVQDRGAAGEGFTHRIGDRVTISTPSLGALVNFVNRSDAIEPWTFGVRSLWRSLAARGLARTRAG